MTPLQIKKIRKRLGLSQAKLARLLGCRSNTIYRWEAGLHPPSEPHSRLLKIVLDTHVNAA